jgi:hypothetical protein
MSETCLQGVFQLRQGTYITSLLGTHVAVRRQHPDHRSGLGIDSECHTHHPEWQDISLFSAVRRSNGPMCGLAAPVPACFPYYGKHYYKHCQKSTVDGIGRGSSSWQSKALKASVSQDIPDRRRGIMSVGYDPPCLCREGIGKGCPLPSFIHELFVSEKNAVSEGACCVVLDCKIVRSLQ